MKNILSISLLLAVLLGCSRPTPSTPEIAKKETVTLTPAIPTDNLALADARFENLKGKVENKSGAQMVWEMSSLKTFLLFNDWIKTHEKSEARINIQNRKKILMKENSILVLLEKQNKNNMQRTVVGVPKGEIYGEMSIPKKGTDELLIKFPHAWVKISSSVQEGIKKIFKMSLTQKSMKVHAIQGSLELQWKNKTQNIFQGEQYQRKVQEIKPDEPNFSELPDEPIESPQNSTENPNVNKNTKKKKKKTSKDATKKVIEKFRILFPKNKALVKKQNIWIEGESPPKTELYFRGKKIKMKNGKFRINVKLNPGLNSLTLQIINNNGVQHHTIEVFYK